MKLFDVTGRRVLLIGGSSGIGYELARGFTSANAHVTIVAEVEAVYDAAKALSVECGRPVNGILCDITQYPAVVEMIAQVGTIDVLINNAAIAGETLVSDSTERTRRLFHQTFEVNVEGLFWVTQEALKSMPDGGRIIFTASLWAKTAGPRFSAYVASKHAVLGLVRSLAIELGPRGITVNAVCPHAVRTDLNLRTMPREMMEALISQMCLRPGLVPPECLVGTYVFLASDAASEMTGQALTVDRGAFIG